MELLYALIIGGVIGWLASIVMKTNAQMGLIANIVVGIIGSMLGTWLAGVMGIGGGSLVVSLLIGLGGAILLIVILKALGIFK